ncbi:MAG: DUF2461 domain-containing protein [Oscillospiraceae bacterium]|nr:DUF2461 domain-containing protein [Oscillospiraceae bacterium]
MAGIMFEGFSPRTFDFMLNLRFNNNKAWFDEHKDEYLCDFLSPMKALGQEVFGRISGDYAKHGFIHKVARIYKDARRVRDGEPYRTNLWFSIERPSEEWTSTPVFWFELSPEEWTYGLGFYRALPMTMAKHRARIDSNPKAFEKLITPLGKQDEFVLDGPEYARKKTAPTEKTAQWYNLKTFALISNNPISDELYSSELVERLVSGYTFLMPFYDYFITLDADPAPVLSD